MFSMLMICFFFYVKPLYLLDEMNINVLDYSHTDKKKYVTIKHKHNTYNDNDVQFYVCFKLCNPFIVVMI